MSIPRVGLGMLAAGIMFLDTGAAPAQVYPNKPIRMVATEAGGGGDLSARTIAQALSVSLGQQVIVENRPSGPIPGEILSKALPDGYTLMFNGMSHWLLPFFQEKLPWDPVKDFAPISLTTTSPN